LGKEYRTIRAEFAEDRFVEKKSEFIAYAARVRDESEAKDFILRIKSTHKDATHNVYAYVLEGTEIARCSDDGEPSGTAGMPVLEVIKREGLVGVCIVVTRYFGGILLGAGGLVRAYAKAAKLGIDKAGTAEFTEHTVFNISVPYADYEKVLRDIPNYGVVCHGTDFSDSVRFSLSCENDRLDLFRSYVADLTSGKTSLEVTGTTFAPKA